MLPTNYPWSTSPSTQGVSTKSLVNKIMLEKN